MKSPRQGQRQEGCGRKVSLRRVAPPSRRVQNQPRFCVKAPIFFLSRGHPFASAKCDLGGPFLPGDLPNCEISHPLQVPVISLCNSAVSDVQTAICGIAIRGFGEGWLPSQSAVLLVPYPRTHIPYNPQPSISRCCI